MRIGLDATWAGVTGTGTASYTDGLVRGLVGQTAHEFVLYFRSGDQLRNPLYRLDTPNVTKVIVDGLGQPGRTWAGLTKAASRAKLDVFHSPGYFLPLWPGPKAVTFHDVNMILQRDKWWRPGMRKSWLSLYVQTLLSSRLARMIVADSQTAGGDVRRALKLPDSRLTVIYPGIDESYFKPVAPECIDKVREQYGLEEFILSVGVLSPQKNLEGLLRAFERLENPSLKLCLVGREDGLYYRQHLVPLIHKLNIADRVVVPGVAPSATLRALYAGASIFLFPSFAEGFGLPPLEAMASGTPVVASNCSCLPEVLGDAAILVDPFDVEAIAATIESTLADSLGRTRLVEAGRQRAARFRWKDSARKALEMYEFIA